MTTKTCKFKALDLITDDEVTGTLDEILPVIERWFEDDWQEMRDATHDLAVHLLAGEPTEEVEAYLGVRVRSLGVLDGEE